jgi:hypothetical protein
MNGCKVTQGTLRGPVWYSKGYLMVLSGYSGVIKGTVWYSTALTDVAGPGDHEPLQDPRESDGPSPCVSTGPYATHPRHICTRVGLTPPTSAPGLGSPRATSAPGLGSPRATSAPGRGSPLSILHQEWAHPPTSAPGLGSPAASSAPGLGSPRHVCIGTGLTPPHLRRNWAHPCHIGTATGLTAASSARCNMQHAKKGPCAAARAAAYRHEDA